jgi:hypothetical protein
MNSDLPNRLTLPSFFTQFVLITTGLIANEPSFVMLATLINACQYFIFSRYSASLAGRTYRERFYKAWTLKMFLSAPNMLTKAGISGGSFVLRCCDRFVIVLSLVIIAIQSFDLLLFWTSEFPYVLAYCMVYALRISIFFCWAVQLIRREGRGCVSQGIKHFLEQMDRSN